MIAVFKPGFKLQSGVREDSMADGKFTI